VKEVRAEGGCRVEQPWNGDKTMNGEIGGSMGDKGPAGCITRIFVSRNARSSAIGHTDNGGALPPALPPVYGNAFIVGLPSYAPRVFVERFRRVEGR